MKKKTAKKTGSKKGEKVDATAEATKDDDKPKDDEKPIGDDKPAEDDKSKEDNKSREDNKPEVEIEPFPDVTNGDDSKEGPHETAKDAEEKLSGLNRSSSHRSTPSISQQSKMRSSSFRKSGGMTSPGFGFPTDGDTAPDIYRKQAIKIDELEKENRRLAKEAGDAEKRWKKVEEELEDLREAEGDSTSKRAFAESPAEIEKLAGHQCFRVCICLLTVRPRKRKLLLFNAKTPNYKCKPHDGMDLPPRCHHPLPQI